ncbi:MAG: hypothetical protein K5852_07030 [Eubacterium sp.]|nr:hypothetical protein [Eubacterium sp.]
MERMSERERKLLLDLQAKAKRVARAEEEFLHEADSRKSELMHRWNLEDRWQIFAEKMGVDADTLYEWISSDQQIIKLCQKHFAATSADTVSKTALSAEDKAEADNPW